MLRACGVRKRGSYAARLYFVEESAEVISTLDVA
jgi:hypothetical protein